MVILARMYGSIVRLVRVYITREYGCHLDARTWLRRSMGMMQKMVYGL